MRFELFEQVQRWKQSLFPIMEPDHVGDEAQPGDANPATESARDEDLAYWMPLFPPC